MESMIKVMVFEPLKEPYIEHIKNVEEAYKSIVEGELREQQLDSKTVIVSNADVASVQLQPNRYVGNEVVCGTFFIASNVGEVGYGSLSKEQIQYYYSMYHTPEEISVEDVEEDRLYGLNAVGRNVVYINNLNLKLDEEAIDFTKVAASYKTEGKVTEYEVKKHIDTIMVGMRGFSKEVTIAKWSDKEPAFDIRAWRVSERDGLQYPLRGITLSKNELIKLREILNSIDVNCIDEFMNVYNALFEVFEQI